MTLKSGENASLTLSYRTLNSGENASLTLSLHGPERQFYGGRAASKQCQRKEQRSPRLPGGRVCFKRVGEMGVKRVRQLKPHPPFKGRKGSFII